MTFTSDTTPNLTELRSKLDSGSEKTQLQAVETLATLTDQGFGVLMEFLAGRQSAPPDPVAGKVYQILSQAKIPPIQEFLDSQFPQGYGPLNSERGVDYSDLQRLLVVEDYQEADRLTLQKLCELSGPAAIQRKWLYFSEVDGLPVTDLQTIDTLWRIYSEGKFGYSVQRQLWLGVNQVWEKLWPAIGWKTGNNWTRYPQEFTWNLSAPKGHLPLSNQLRGVRFIAALFAHRAWL